MKSKLKEVFIYVHLKLICLSVWYSWISTITYLYNWHWL